MLDDHMKTQLQAYLGRLTRPIELVASLDEGEASGELRTLLAELASLSRLITVLTDTDNQIHTPSFAIRAAGSDARLRFAGVPLGHEFTSLVLALLQVGGYPPKIDAALMGRVATLDGDHSFQTYVSLSCQNCPDVVQALNLMAVLTPRIRPTLIDGALFHDEVARNTVMAVPTVFLNGAPFAQRRMALEEIVAKLDSGSVDREKEELNAKPPFDVLIVGGGPAAAAAAIYAARKGIRTGIAAERFGGQLLDTVGIENFVSVSATDGPKLASELEQHVRSHDVDVMNRQRAEALVPGELIEVRFVGGVSLRARSVILATGARWREMNVPGESTYRNRGVAYCPHCDGPLFKGKPVAVIGGGNSGVEAAIDLAGLVSHVTLIEFDWALRADAVLTSKLKSLSNVTVITGAQTTEVTGDGERVTGLVYKDRDGSALRSLPLAGIFVQIGLVPSTDWIKDSVKLSRRGEIEVDARGQTSVPGVFAAGDCTTVPFKQIVIAVGEGAKAALGAFEHLIREPVSAAA